MFDLTATLSGEGWKNPTYSQIFVSEIIVQDNHSVIIDIRYMHHITK